MKKLKVLTIFGTRPEAIKMAPLVIELKSRSGIESFCCVTAQHREMLDSALDFFGINTNFDLNIMDSGQTLTDVTTKSLIGLESVLNRLRPDIALVHGDTTTAFSGALAAFYSKVKVGHVEAGLRSFDKYSPYPEEMNRKLVSHISDLHFCPTEQNAKNLKGEGIERDVYITGNTVIDAMRYTVGHDVRFEYELLNQIDFKNRRVVTMTCHRRENYGEPMENIMSAVKRIASEYEDVEVVYPVHMSPEVRKTANRMLSSTKNVTLIDPVGTRDMHNLMSRSYMVLTDSGGLQEEAPALGKPVLVLRRETERPEALEAGTVELAGVEEAGVYNAFKELLDSKEKYMKMSRAVNPYGDGEACRRIADAIEWHFGLRDNTPDRFSSGI